MLKTLIKLYYTRLSRKNYREFERGYADAAVTNLRKLPDLVRNRTGALRAGLYLCDNPYRDGLRTADADYRLLIGADGEALQEALRREQVLLARIADLEDQATELNNKRLALIQGLRQSNALGVLGGTGIGGMMGSCGYQEPKD